MRAHLFLVLLGACGARTDLGGSRSIADAASPDASSCGSITSNAGCGASQCGGTACIATLASGPVVDIAVDATNLFWTTGDAVMESTRCGASPRSLAVCTEATFMTLDTSNVYFAAGLPHAQQITSTVSRVAKTGGAMVQLATFPNEQIRALARNGGDLYLAAEPLFGVNGRIVRLPTAGGPATTIAAPDELSPAIAVDDDFVFWVDGNLLMRSTHDGTAPTVLADTFLAVVSDSGALSIEVDAQFVYWTNGCGAIARVPRDAAATPTTPTVVAVVSTSQGVECTDDGSSRHIALDDADVYLTFAGNGAVSAGLFRAPKTGGELTSLVVDDDPIGPVVTDGIAVFWADQHDARAFSPK